MSSIFFVALLAQRKESSKGWGGKLTPFLEGNPKKTYHFLSHSAQFGLSDPFLADTNMAEIETLGILDEIQALVSDKLQVVTLS